MTAERRLEIAGRRNAALEEENEKLVRELDSATRIVRALAAGEIDAAAELPETRRTADDLLRASEERYRLIIETTSEGVWLSDASFTTTFVNERLADMLGYTREEIIGQPVVGFLTEEGRAVALAKMERRKRGIAGETYENSYRRKDGTTLWALARTNAILGDKGEFRGAVGLLSNLTEQRKVAATRDQLAAIVESSGDAIVSKTLEGKITSWNRAAERLFGYTAEEIVGRPAALLVPADRAEEEPLILARVARGEEMDHTDTVRRRKDGSLVDVSIHISVLRDADGRIVGASKIARDITERRRHEAALRESEERRRQSQKMEAVGLLAGGIAHDFNNILSVVLGYTNLILQELDAKEPIYADLQQVHEAGVRAAELTRQLLAFSRQQVLRPRVLDLNGVVTGIQRMLVRVLGEDMMLTLRTSNALGIVHADASQIEQILMNLVINARDAMPQGGNVTVETKNVFLEAAGAGRYPAVSAGTYAMLAVTDTGTGMDQPTLERAFDPFFTTKEMGKGTGLGLSTVHGIVEQSGGHIRVRSELGRGTTFEIYLPTTERALQPLQSIPPSGPSCRGSETILIVEDDDRVRQVMRAILTKQGYEVLEAQNGGEAFLIAEKSGSAIQLLVTDVVMPRMGGGELADLLLARHPEMAVLYVSGHSRDAVVRHGVRDEGRAFLAKPMTPGGLAQMVREVLDTAVRDRTQGAPVDA